MGTSMTKIMVVGLGGIGSWLIDKVSWLVDQKQLKNIEIHGYDPDSVEEKNIRYQNFTANDIFENKAVALDIRYHSVNKWFWGHNELITQSKQLKDYDLVVSAVDNLKLRELLYLKSSVKNWIDLRSEGRTIMIITSNPSNNTNILKGLVKGDKEVSGGCQLQSDLDAGIVQLGNQIVALIGTQLILNWHRNVTLPALFTHIF